MSEVLQIRGGTPLSGTIQASGAKNASLPLLITALLTAEPCVFHNVPVLEDVRLTLQLLEHLGAKTSFSQNTARIEVPQLVATEASYSLVKSLRASFWVLAPLLARGGAARVALPGGDAIGARPVDIHLDALRQMGADISVKHGVVFAAAPEGLRPATIHFRFPSVGATHQLMMAASLTPGETVITGAAKEPEIIAVAECINQMGGSIEGAGTDTIIIKGRSELGGATVRVIGDRIEAGTYLMAAAATKGDITVEGIDPLYFGSFRDILDQMGVEVTTTAQSIRVNAPKGLRAVSVKTAPFPLFATDLQAPLMAALTLAEGESTIQESMFEGRFGHVGELCRMGASIIIQDHTAIIQGVPKLSGALVEGLDIRAAAALVIAGLAAEGVTTITEVSHLKRGYEKLLTKLTTLGASAWMKVQDPDDFMFSGC
jgi:UDP-N-acetylglucosamine 1-carboxyvinyltransferase